MEMVIERCLQLGARLARPGEFSERAFLNDKIDLIQAESISDLINASSKASAQSAVLSKQGVFSDLVNELIEEIIDVMKSEHNISYDEMSRKFETEDSFNVVINNGASAGQTVFHLHLHLLAGRDFSDLFPA